MLVYSEKQQLLRRKRTTLRRMGGSALVAVICCALMAMTVLSADGTESLAEGQALTSPTQMKAPDSTTPQPPAPAQGGTVGAPDSTTPQPPAPAQGDTVGAPDSTTPQPPAPAQGDTVGAPVECICTGDKCNSACAVCQADQLLCKLVAAAPVAPEISKRTVDAQLHEIWVREDAVLDAFTDGSQEHPFRYLNQAREMISGTPQIVGSIDSEKKDNPGEYTVHIVGRVHGAETLSLYTDGSNAGHLKALAGQNVTVIGEGAGAEILPTDGNSAVLSVTGGTMTVTNVTIHGFPIEMNPIDKGSCDSPAVFVWGGTFTLGSNAVITGNYNSCGTATPDFPSAGWGGGSVYVGGPEGEMGTFQMLEGSKVTGGRAAIGKGTETTAVTYRRYCGGVILNNGKLQMTGGEITDNDGVIGAGVYVDGSGIIELSGTAQIHHNHGPAATGEEGVENNVYLSTGRSIVIGSEGLQPGADVGVYCQSMPEPYEGKTLIATNSAAEDQKYLHSDIPTEAAVLKQKAEPANIYLAYANARGETMAEGKAAPNVTVIFVDVETGDRQETTSDASGHFQTALPAGTYLVAARNADNTQSSINAERLVILPNSEVANLEVGPLTSGALVIGEVLNGTNGVKDAKVTLTETKGTQKTTTSVGGGVYAIAGVAPGKVNVSATATISDVAYAGSTGADVPSAEDVNVVIAAEVRVTVTGGPVLTGDLPHLSAVGAVVTITAPDGTRSQGKVDADGNFSVPDITLVADKTGYTVSVDDGKGHTYTNANVTLDDSGAISSIAGPIYLSASVPDTTKEEPDRTPSREETVWNQAESTIKDAKPGASIVIQAPENGLVPEKIIQDLYDRGDVSLVIKWGGEDIVIPAGTAFQPAANRIAYPLADLLELSRKMHHTSQPLDNPSTGAAI